MKRATKRDTYSTGSSDVVTLPCSALGKVGGLPNHIAEPADSTETQTGTIVEYIGSASCVVSRRTSAAEIIRGNILQKYAAWTMPHPWWPSAHR